MPIARIAYMTLPVRALGENKLRIAPLQPVLCIWLGQSLKVVGNMNNSDCNFRLLLWQQQVIQAQELALKMPEQGLNADVMPMLSFEQLRGVLAFLMRVSAESKV